MPDNKKPSIRYVIIDSCIRNTARDYSLMDLLEAVNEELLDRGFEKIKSRTTIYQDLKDMEFQFQAPIEKVQKGRNICFKYSDPKYSYSNQPLNQGEIERLKDAVHILSRFSGVPGFEWIDDVTSKLELGTLEKASNRSIISFESNEFLKGKEYIGEIFHAILAKQVLEITYQKFGDTPKKHLMHPYYLKEYDDRWYVLGLQTKKDDLITLSVDRINKIVVRDDLKFIENTRFDFVDYFEDLIGISKRRDSEPLLIKLKFSKLMADYVLTKPLHGSQKSLGTDAEGNLMIQIEVIPNPELENQIFWFKNEVEVLEPETFRLRMESLVHDLYGKYNSQVN